MLPRGGRVESSLPPEGYDSVPHTVISSPARAGKSALVVYVLTGVSIPLGYERSSAGHVCETNDPVSARFAFSYRRIAVR